jgi:hypothetical protein
VTTAALLPAGEPAAAEGVNLEADVARLLAELSDVQAQLLNTLARKRTILAEGNLAALAELQSHEEELVRRLEQCQATRQQLLAQAKSAGKPADSIASLSASLPGPQRANLGKQVKLAKQQMRLLQNESLANWVLAQRLLLHVSQLLEIIATGGRLKPTYGEGESSAHGCGALVNDQA